MSFSDLRSDHFPVKRSKNPHKAKNREDYGVNKEYGFGWLGLSLIFGRAESKGKPCLLPCLY